MAYHSISLNDKIQIWVTWFLRFTLIVAVVFQLFEQQYVLAISTAIIFLLTFLPSLFEKHYKIELPNEYEFVVILFIYATTFLGELQGYYTKFWWWDVILHTGSGIAIGFIGFLFMYILYYKQKINMNPMYVAVFAFAFALSIGALWEVYEFTMDQLLGWNMQPSLVDTMWDLIVDAVGAFITSVIGYYYLVGRKTPIFKWILHKFIDANRHIFHKK